MKQKTYLFLAVILLCVIGTTSGGQSADNPAQKPNILFIAVDDLRPNLGAYGHSFMHTPRMDELADSGTLFQRATRRRLSLM